MPEIKWIKILTTMFDDEKIKLIEAMPDRDAVLIIWIKLLTQAGKCNASGCLVLNQNIPYTDEMLSTIFNRPITTIRMALGIFEKFEMIEREDQTIYISNWEKHQNIDGMERIREQNKLRKKKERERKKMLFIENVSRDSHVTVTQSHATDIDIDIDIEKDINTLTKNSPPYEKIVELFNEKCHALPKVTTLTASRKKTLKIRWEELKSIDQFEKLFTMVAKSDFLNGKNNTSWKVTFDWLFSNDKNYVKVLEGNYDNKNNNNDWRDF